MFKLTKVELVMFIIVLIVISFCAGMIITNEKICKPRLKYFFDTGQQKVDIIIK